MKRLPRLLPCVALACSLAMPMLSASAAPPRPEMTAPPPVVNPPADAAAAPAAPPGDATSRCRRASRAPRQPCPQRPSPPAQPTEPAAPEVGANQTLNEQVDDFWHYGEIGRYDIQAALGNRIVAAGQQNPEDVLKAFESVAGQHHLPNGAPSDMDTALLRWQSADAKMRTVATQVIDVLNKGRFARRQSPEFIAANIKRLDQGERAFSLAMQQLSNSGELAVPQLVSILMSQKPEDVQKHDVVRRALITLGAQALNRCLRPPKWIPRTLP